MANPEHVAKLKEGVEAWNKWREENEDVIPDLSGAYLEGAYLYKVASPTERALSSIKDVLGILEIIDQGINLKEANLEGVNLTKATLKEANLEGANLIDANLTDAHLGNEISKGIFSILVFLEPFTYLNNADLTGSDLTNADLSRVMLKSANLKGANLNKTDLKGALLDEANLSEADLKYSQNYVLNRNRVVNTQFHPRAKDPWSVLRRKYTGPMLLFNIILLISFIIPFFLKTVFWVGVNRGQDTAAQFADSLVVYSLRTDQSLATMIDGAEFKISQVSDSLANNLKSLSGRTDLQAILTTISNLEEELSIADSSTVKQLQDIESYISSKLPDSTMFSPCLEPTCVEYTIGEVLLSFDKDWKAWILVVGLLVYNLARMLLTWRVGLLRDAEERSHITPSYRSYKNWYMVHKFVMVPLVIVSVAAFVFNAYEWLINTTVFLPAPVN